MNDRNDSTRSTCVTHVVIEHNASIDDSPTLQVRRISGAEMSMQLSVVTGKYLLDFQSV